MTQTNYNNETLLSFRNALDATGVLAVQAEAEMALRGGGDIVVDLGEVSFLDPSGIGLLVFMFKRQKAKKHGLRIVGVHGQPARLLRQLNLERALGVGFNDNDMPAARPSMVLQEAS